MFELSIESFTRADSTPKMTRDELLIGNNREYLFYAIIATFNEVVKSRVMIQQRYRDDN